MPTKTLKAKIAKKLFGYSPEVIDSDFKRLSNINCNNIQQVSTMSIAGNKLIDYYTGKQRLDTKGDKGIKGISFYEFWKHRNTYKKKPYIRKTLDYSLNKFPNRDEVKRWKYIYDLYASSITIFRPITAMSVYCKFKPHAVLDPTMGWGGRLLGAYIAGVPEYIGIELNTDLKEPYKQLINDIKKRNPDNHTKFKLMFQDALTVDYSKLHYDMVFTSPPYYNIEQYKGTPIRTKEEWKHQFYIPLIEKTWTYLQKNGVYCLNVPIDIYKDICFPILGKETYTLPLKKTKRTSSDKYKEFIYCWKKN
jgi:hypothetical protein